MLYFIIDKGVCAVAFAFNEPKNRIITNLPARARSLIKKLSAKNEQEIVCTWLLAWTAQQLRVSMELLEQKFLPDEINELKKLTKEGSFTPANPPTAEYLSNALKKDKLLSAQAGSLSPQELLYLSLEMYMDELQEDVLKTRQFISAREFGLALSPPRSKERIAVLCKEGRIPGSIKDPYDGQWHIPADAVPVVEAALNQKRAEFYHKGALPSDKGK